MDSAQAVTSYTAPFDEVVQQELMARLETLRRASQQNGDSPQLASFVEEVDAAWKRFQNGTYGICEECHEPLGADRMLAEPLARICLNELTGKQREALEDDLQFAAQIQIGLLPERGFSHDRWVVDYAYQPQGIVSGDYCDVIAEGDDLYFILGDVSGKGMAASLLMSNLHAMFHSLIPLKLELTELVSRANRLLLRSSLSNQFATLICGRAGADGQVEVVNAGHLSPLVIKNGVEGELDSAGLPLGMFSEAEFTSSHVQLDSGDMLLIYSDGVTETTNPSDVEYGVDRLHAAINTSAFSTPGDLIASCLEHVASFRGMAERRDDLSMLALSFK